MASAEVTIVVVDGDPLALPSVLAALSHASAIQPGARVGIDVGGEDEARAAAAALCAGAERGQVLVSDRVRSSMLGRDGHEFRELGTSDGVHGWELLWQEPAPRTRIRLCGPLELTIDGRDLAAALPGGQAALLVGYLLANRDRAADRDELIDVLWPERPPRDPQGALRPILSRLRHALAPATLEGRERLRLALPEPVWLDVEEAQRAIETTRALVKGEAWGSAREYATAALDLLRGEFLPGYDGDWIVARRQELEEIELEALEGLARAGLALAGPELNAAERAGRELIARSPFRETGYRFLMEALARGGNTAEALRVYEQLRVLLRDELGAAPAAEVQELHQRLLTGATAAQPQEPSRPAAESERRVPLPSILSLRERSAFVARERELDVLRAAWQQARGGARRLVLVAGEPGIGKTRLTSEFAREAHAEGTVLYAGCQEEALVAYQPFVEALRHYARTAALDWDELALGPGAGELALLVPEFAATQPADSGARADDPETRRYLLFDAISMLLAEVAARTPLAFVIDDLHWADRATLRLLRHVLRASQDAPLLIVGTYRDAEIGPEHPLADLLADLRRDRLLERVSLDGLEEGEVATLIASHAGHEAPAGLVETVHEQTEGNPFFVEEVMRHLIETGVVFERGGRWTSALTPDEIGVPEGVKEVLARRLGRLSDSCRAALAQAAVLGREFSFEVLRAMTAADDEELIAVVEEAVGAQLVVEVTGRSSPAYAFTHALVRETLYGALSGPRKQRMHATAAQAIERVEGDAQVGVIALHYRLAGSTGDAGKAIEYSLQAGGRAAELSAWDAVADHWEGALAIMERAGRPEAERARLLIALGDVMAVLGDLAGRSRPSSRPFGFTRTWTTLSARLARTRAWAWPTR